jgi:sugar phosphate permease
MVAYRPFYPQPGEAAAQSQVRLRWSVVSSDPPSGSRRRAWGIWVAVLSVYLLAVFHRSSLGVAGILAAERFGVSAGQLSTFVMVQLLVYAAMQVPVGALLDRFGSRRMLLTGLALMTLAQTGFALAESYPAGLALRVLLGAGDAMIFISVLRVVALWFPDSQVPVVNQLTGMLGQVGGVIAAIPLSASLWGFPFLVTVHEVSATTAGALITVMVLSAVVVGPLVGRQVARHPFSRSTMVLWIVAAMAAAWTVVLLWPGPAPLPVLVALMVVVGVGGPGSMVGFDMARTFNPAARLGSATGIVNVGGFVASLLTVVSIGLALDLLTPGGSTDYRPDDFRLAMAVQVVPWALGSWQIWRLRRRTRRQLAQTDPDAYDALKAGFAGSVVERGD